MEGNISFELAVEDPRWQEKVPFVGQVVAEAALAGLAQAGFEQPAVLDVLLTDDAEIRALNRTHRGQDKPTNVLSFPVGETPAMPGAPRPLGAVAVGFETLEREANEANRHFSDHFRHLIIHASLHLIGYTHDADDEAERMEALEIAALAGLGVANPYDDATPGPTTFGTREQ